MHWKVVFCDLGTCPHIIVWRSQFDILERGTSKMKNYRLQGRVIRFVLGVLIAVSIYAPDAIAIECPKDAQTWNIWRDTVVEKITGGEELRMIYGEAAGNTAYAGYSSKTAGSFLENTISVIEQCQSFYSKLPTVQKCLTHLREMVTAHAAHLFRGNHNPLDNSLTVPSKDYGKRAAAILKFPKWMNQKRFLDAFNEPGFEAVAKLIDEQNRHIQDTRKKIIYARFDGFSFMAYPLPEPRFMIYIPGNPERFVLVRQPDPKTDRECKKAPCPIVIDLEGVFSKSDGRRVHYFYEPKDMPELESPTKRTSENISLNSRRSKTDNCFSCHATGGIAIHGPVDPRDQASAEFINRRIKTSHNGDFDGYSVLSKMGPGYGPSNSALNEARSLAFFKRCSEGTVTTEASATRLRNNMRCMNCHDDSVRARLTPSNSPMMKRYILSGLMPPKQTGHDYLIATERKALYDCLRYEQDHDYLDDQGKVIHRSTTWTWLTQESCTGNSSGSNSEVKKQNIIQEGGIKNVPSTGLKKPASISVSPGVIVK